MTQATREDEMAEQEWRATETSRQVAAEIATAHECKCVGQFVCRLCRCASGQLFCDLPELGLTAVSCIVRSWHDRHGEHKWEIIAEAGRRGSGDFDWFAPQDRPAISDAATKVFSEEQVLMAVTREVKHESRD